jgi:hypothetical protein
MRLQALQDAATGLEAGSEGVRPHVDGHGEQLHSERASARQARPGQARSGQVWDSLLSSALHGSEPPHLPCTSSHAELVEHSQLGPGC